MEFSKQYRQLMCDDLKALFLTDASGVNQTTHFFTGAVPSVETLTAVMAAEWQGAAKAPSDPSSAFYPQRLGEVSKFLKNCTWFTDEKTINISHEAGNSVEAGSLPYTYPVALEGLYTAAGNALALSGFDHAEKGDQPITWALTLWGTRADARAWYVLHRVGTKLDPQAEIVLNDNVLAADNLTPVVLQVYSPIF